MTRPANQSATSPIALGAAATPARLSAGALGNSASKAALADINQAIGEMKALAVQPLLQGAVEALNRGDYKGGGALALQALERDERNGFGWYLLAISREAAGDFAGSITCYESALGLLPDHAEIANNLGRLAFRLGQPIGHDAQHHGVEAQAGVAAGHADVLALAGGAVHRGLLRRHHAVAVDHDARVALGARLAACDLRRSDDLGEVLGEVVALLRGGRRLDEAVVLHEIRVPLISLAADESVESIKPLLKWP